MRPSSAQTRLFPLVLGHRLLQFLQNKLSFVKAPHYQEVVHEQNMNLGVASVPASACEELIQQGARLLQPSLTRS